MVILKYVFVFILCWNCMGAQEQFVLKGTFPQAANKEILLKGFTLKGDSLLVQGKINKKGGFVLKYPAQYIGAAVLEVKASNRIIVLLNHENFEIQWTDFTDLQTLNFKKSLENTAFLEGLSLYQKSEGKRVGLTYLIGQYAEEPEIRSILQTELQKQDVAFPAFLAQLPDNLYVKYYMKLRQLVADIPLTASHYIDRLPVEEIEFNSLNFGGMMPHTGLYNDLFLGYFTLLESYGVADQYKHMNPSIDAVVKSLKSNPVLLQDVAQNVFNLLEKRSLYPAAEHLALAMLEESSCQLDTKHQALFEQYRKMAKGKKAPEIVFTSPVNGFKTLSAMNYKYKLVVFGASWCDKCREELPKLIPFYAGWKKKEDLEIVFISLDQDKTTFEQFTKDFPWLSSCDFQSWEGQAAQDYCIFATPTMYLLDKDNTIVMKIVTPEHLNAVLVMLNNNETVINQNNKQ
jgi:thiol-disulfide isomerase/thioredoxin